MLPWAFFIAFAAPLLFFRRNRPSNRLTCETALRDIRFLGYIGSSVVAIGGLTVIGIGAAVITADFSGPARLVDIFFPGLLAGWAGLCILPSAVLFVLRRMVNDHNQIERGNREILETLERLRSEKSA